MKQTVAGFPKRDCMKVVVSIFIQSHILSQSGWSGYGGIQLTSLSMKPVIRQETNGKKAKLAKVEGTVSHTPYRCHTI